MEFDAASPGDAAPCPADRFPALRGTAYFEIAGRGLPPLPAVLAAREAAEWTAGCADPAEVAELRARARLELVERCAQLWSTPIDRIRLTGSTREGLVHALAALRVEPEGDILTSDHEHASTYEIVRAFGRRSGCSVRVAHFDRLRDDISGRTALIVSSHVSRVSGAELDLGELSPDVPVVLDGAQALGAVETSPDELGCIAYAAAAHKHLCAPQGLGVLWLAADAVAAEPLAALPPPPLELSAPAVASHDELAAAGWDRIRARAAELSGAIRSAIEESGVRTLPGGRAPIVAWPADDPDAVRRRLQAAGVVIASLHSRGLARVSVGPWNTDADVERLVSALGLRPAASTRR